MKPTTDALHHWLQALIINKNFQCTRLYKGDNCDGNIEWEYVPYNNFKGEHIVPALKIHIYTCVENKKFVQKVLFTIQTPDMFCSDEVNDGGDREDDYKSYRNIHLKDLVRFKELCDEQFDKIRHLYFKDVPYEPAKSKDVYCKEYRDFLMFKESMFGYFYNCEKINSKLKDLNKDFVKGE